MRAPVDPDPVRRRRGRTRQLADGRLPMGAVLAGASVLMAGFIATRAAGREPPRSAGVPGRRPSTEHVERLQVPDIPRLHDAADPIALSPEPRRDLFAFRLQTSTRHVAPGSAAPLVVESVPPAVREDLTWTLIGIAEDPGAEGPRRTAIISTRDQLSLVCEGDVIDTHYRVNAISSDAAELMDITSGTTHRLVFK